MTVPTRLVRYLKIMTTCSHSMSDLVLYRIWFVLWIQGIVKRQEHTF